MKVKKTNFKSLFSNNVDNFKDLIVSNLVDECNLSKFVGSSLGEINLNQIRSDIFRKFLSYLLHFVFILSLFMGDLFPDYGRFIFLICSRFTLHKY